MTQDPMLLMVAAGVFSLLLGLLAGYLMSRKQANAEASRNAVLTHSLQDQTQKNERLEEQTKELGDALQTLKVGNAEQSTRLKLLELEHQKLQSSAEEAHLRQEKAVTDSTQLKAHLSSTAAQLEAEVHKVDALKQAQQQLQAALDTAQQALSQEKDKNALLAKNVKGLEVSVVEADKSHKALQHSHEEQKEKSEQLQQQYTRLIGEHAELKTSLEERDNSHREKVAQLEESKQMLTKEFENLANKIFEEKGKTFTHTSKSSIDDMLKPFREQIEGFQKRVNEVHDASLKGNTHLNSEIQKVLDVGLKMSAEATSLTSALKGDSQQRGAWGEAQLQRTLEMSGLIADAHYETQTSFKDAQGKQKQTDYLIKLPDDKHIIIDSKVTLLAYEKVASAQTDQEYALAMAEHGKAVKKHIDDLASKDYTNLVGMRSPSFVLMFMPIEPAYIDALKNNKDLFSYGYEKGIVLVSHTTLIPILRTVANLWVMEKSNHEAREISDRAGEIFNSVCMVTERLQKLGNTLNTASKHYNDTVTSLVGQQGLHGKVSRFTLLSNKVSKTLPAIEPTHIDFETEKMRLIAEPIDSAPAEDVADKLTDETNKVYSSNKETV